DGVTACRFGGFAWLWRVVHEQGLIVTGGPALFVAYPRVPWIGVMAAGFCFGRIYLVAAERRRRLLLTIGFSMIAAFVVIRGLNVYGDPRPWTQQTRPLFTLLSFL